MKSIVEVAENQEVNSEVNPIKYTLYSSFLERMVNLELIANEGSKKNEQAGLLLLNDGQDLRKLGLPATLKRISKKETVIPFTLVAISAGERKREYGVSGEPDYMGRGSKAALYHKFIIFELLPWIHSKLGTYIAPELTAFAGCSLGGLSALDIVS
ncbi:MAG TPA: alpha/beta hydrolase-fold protein, partial [Bacteroidia bacterium]|nr:alpha/beta hydrolase-fold protein [Bacteroidia bacterium]